MFPPIWNVRCVMAVTVPSVSIKAAWNCCHVETWTLVDPTLCSWPQSLTFGSRTTVSCRLWGGLPSLAPPVTLRWSAFSHSRLLPHSCTPFYIRYKVGSAYGWTWTFCLFFNFAANFIHFSSWLRFRCLYVARLCFPFTRWWRFRLLQFLLSLVRSLLSKEALWFNVVVILLCNMMNEITE